MTIEDRSQEFFDAIERGEDPLQDLLAKRKRKAKQRELDDAKIEPAEIEEITI